MQKQEVDTNLPMITKISPEEAERQLIYRVLLDLKMSIEEIRTYLLGTHAKPAPYPDIKTPFEDGSGSSTTGVDFNAGSLDK